MMNPTVFGLMAMAKAWGWKEMLMPSNQTDVDGIPEYEAFKGTCETCGVEPCPVAGQSSGSPGTGCDCWVSRAPCVRRPKDFSCLLRMIGNGGSCVGAGCYLWSKLGPEEETGVPGTCMIALALADMIGPTSVSHGVAMEEGEGS